MTASREFREAMLGCEQSLKAFATSLSGNVDRAQDLVQETFLRALANHTSFEPGTHMSAWLFTILRNLFRSEYRKRRREVEDTDGSYTESLKSHPEQHSRIEFQEFRQLLARLPTEQRESLILVGASGFSYEEAAAICQCAVGTIKSRVNRARTRMADMLGVTEDDLLFDVKSEWGGVMPVEFSRDTSRPRAVLMHPDANSDAYASSRPANGHKAPHANGHASEPYARTLSVGGVSFILTGLQKGANGRRVRIYEPGRNT